MFHAEASTTIAHTSLSAELAGEQHTHLTANDQSLQASVHHVPAVQAIKFAQDDLPAIADLVGLQVLYADQQYSGSNQLYLMEQIVSLDR